MAVILLGNLARLNALCAFSVREIASKIIWSISTVVMIYNYAQVGWDEEFLKNITSG